jgi:hypothetical protein
LGAFFCRWAHFLPKNRPKLILISSRCWLLFVIKIPNSNHYFGEKILLSTA